MTERKKLTITQKLSELEGFLRALRKLKLKITKKEFFADEMPRRLIERYLQLALEAVIDISTQIINEEKFRKPTEYREAIDILGEEGILPGAFSHKFAPAAGFRNILVHDYVRLDTKKVFEHFQNDLPDIEKFVRHVKEYLRRK